MNLPLEYVMHDALGVEHNKTMAIVGQLTDDELSLIKSLPHNEDQFGFESEISVTDEDLAFKYNFNINDCIYHDDVKEDDFVLFDFGFGKDKANNNVFKKIIALKYPEIFEYEAAISQMYCDTFFANAHHDKEVVSARGQLMFILENNIGHRLLSIDENNIEHVITPKAGDIILLDISCIHAVMPNQEHGIEAMRKNTLTFAAVSYNN